MAILNALLTKDAPEQLQQIKYFDLTILIVTHSFQFLESLNFFMKN